MEKSYVLCNGVRINFFEMFMRKNYRQTDKLELGDVLMLSLTPFYSGQQFFRWPFLP